VSAPPRLIGLLVAIGLLALATGPFSALAHGEDDGEDIHETSPYLVEVSPSQLRSFIGPELIVVTVLDAATSKPVPDARVLIRVRNDEKGIDGFATALSTPAARQWYRAEVLLDAPGVWKLSVEISGPLGQAVIHLPPTEVRTPNQSVGGYLIYTLVLGAIAAGAGYLILSARRSLRTREER
jgi:hypothetical protein